MNEKQGFQLENIADCIKHSIISHNNYQLSVA